MPDYSNIITISQDFKGGKWFAEGQKDLCGRGGTPQKALEDLLCNERKEKYTLKWDEERNEAYDGHYFAESKFKEECPNDHREWKFYILEQKNFAKLFPENSPMKYSLKTEYINSGENIVFYGATIEECKARAQEIINKTYKDEIEGE